VKVHILMDSMVLQTLGLKLKKLNFNYKLNENFLKYLLVMDFFHINSEE